MLNALCTVMSMLCQSFNHIVNKLNPEIAQIMRSAETNKAFFLDAGVEISLSTPAKLNPLMVSRLCKWGKVVKEAGIKLEQA